MREYERQRGDNGELRVVIDGHIKSMGTKDNSSTNERVDIDSFVVIR
jgi:hypothetical protein